MGRHPRPRRREGDATVERRRRRRREADKEGLMGGKREELPRATGGGFKLPNSYFLQLFSV